VVICLERGAHLHMAQLMPLPLAVSCFSKIQTAFTFLVPAYPGSSGQRAVKRVCVCVCASPRGQRDDMPPLTRGRSTSVRGRVRSPHISSGRPAAGSQRADSLGSCATPRLGQTDRRTDGRIAVSLNAPYSGGIINYKSTAGRAENDWALTHAPTHARTERRTTQKT